MPGGVLAEVVKDRSLIKQVQVASCRLQGRSKRNTGAKPILLATLNAWPTARRGRLKAVLFHGSPNIIVASIKPVPLTNAEAESFGTKGIPPLRVGMTRSLFFRKL